ncbi:MAG TPA: acyl-CoA dehydrogenase [Polyangiaceae bacterium]|jgi:butyryl-CoA dehydrogenase
MPESQNPLLRDRDVDFLLYEMLAAEELCTLPAFAEHSRETFDLYLRSTRRLAREVLFPAYRPMDEAPARLEGGGMVTHPKMKGIWPQLVGLGVVSATRPASVGGQGLPMTVSTLAHAYLMAANPSAYGYAGLTTGAAHLIEAFGDETLKRELMARMYAGEWTGTMALTEPHAGSSLADVTSRATPRADGTYGIRGSKIFISGADHDLTDNVVNMTLARIDGAPAGIKGISLFAVPKRRFEGGALVPNDVTVAGVIHKIGWRGLPSLALAFGDRSDCRGWLVGEAHKGISYMFQMMNEARIMVGVNGTATASVAYHAALAYARNRPQGRPVTAKSAGIPQVPIVEHADVRRMLLRQKAIVEGAMALVCFTAKQSDLAEHAPDPEMRRRAGLLLDTLTPIAKTFPAEWGFEANVLSLQIHGGYGYSSEQLPEAWLRDQKLNSIHEGTTGIHGLDLLGRKAIAQGGEPIRILLEETEKTIARAEKAGIPAAWTGKLREAMQTLAGLTAHLAALGMGGDVDGMMRHSADYLSLFAIVVVGWLWLWQATLAKEALARGATDPDFYEGKLCAADYWLVTEVPKVAALATLCRSGEDSYARMRDAWF